MNDNEYSIVLLGNGLDLALGKKTSISDFLEWIQKKSDFKKNGITVNEHNELKKFIEIYQIWCESEKRVDTYWSNIEKNIVDFFYDLEINFISFKKKIKNKIRENIFERLKFGYEIFCFLMQEYYIKELKQRINEKSIPEIDEKVEKIINWLNNKNEILSLNYTNLKDFIHSNTTFYKFLPEIKIYFIHFIAFGVSFYEYLGKLLSSKSSKNKLDFLSFGDAFNQFTFYYSNIELSDRNKFTEPHEITKQKLFLPASSRKCKKKCEDCCQKPLIINNSTKKYYQLLILGNSSEHGLHKNVKYNFLSKNKNKNLFVKHYPNFILNCIKQNVKLSHPKKYIYIFGYSFGEADKMINDFLFNLINKEFIIKITFFKNDINNKELLEKNHRLYNTFLHFSKREPISYETYINNIEWI